MLGYQVGQDFDEKNWLQDRQSYDLASKAVTMVLEALHPDSTITLDAMMEDAPNKRRADDAPYWGVTSALLEAKLRRQTRRKRK